MSQRQHVLEHRLVRLRRAGALRSSRQPSTQHEALTFGPLEPFVKPIALAAALRQLGMQSTASGKARDKIA